MAIVNNITQLIGNTPLVRLNKMNQTGANVYGKLESYNPGGSVKDRLALAMIVKAEEEEKINANTLIVEPTSGNTGIGLAMVCAYKGYQLVLTMPESMSEERKKLLSAYGAKLVLTPASDGMKGAIKKAKDLTHKNKNSFMPMQFSNKANVDMHRRTTAEEIWKDTEGKVDVFVAGAGTGGTITGVGERLKELKKDVYIATVEPENSPVLSGGEAGPHKIMGIGAGFVPDIMNLDILDEIVQVNYDHALETARKLASEEGILSGISSGANVYAALKIAEKEENKGKTIVAIICDTGERYLSTSLFNV